MPADYTAKEYIIKVNDKKAYILTEFAKELQRALVNDTVYNADTDTLEIVIPPGLSIVSQVTNSNGDVTTTFSDGTVIVVPNIVVPEGLTIVSQVTNEQGGITTTFSDGTVIVVPKVNIPNILYYTFSSSDGSVEFERTTSGDDEEFVNVDITVNPSLLPEGLTIIAQNEDVLGVTTLFSDGTSIFVPNQSPVYTHWSPDNSIIIEQDDVNKIVTHKVNKTIFTEEVEHLTSYIESDFLIDGEDVEITDLDYIQRAGELDENGVTRQPVADIEMALFTDGGVIFTGFEPDNPNSYSIVLHQDTLDNGYFYKARLFGDITTKLPTTWKLIATSQSSGSVIAPSHWLIHRWMQKIVVANNDLLFIGFNVFDEYDMYAYPVDVPIKIYFNSNISFVDTSIPIMNLFDGTTTTEYYASDCTITDNTLILNNPPPLLGYTLYFIEVYANTLQNDQGNKNTAFTAWKPDNYFMTGEPLVPPDCILTSDNQTDATSVTVIDAETKATITVIDVNDWAKLGQYLPYVIRTEGIGLCAHWSGNPDYDFNLPKCKMFAPYFLYFCADFNKKVTFPNDAVISEGFLSNCSSFNQAISLGASVDFEYFMSYCTDFNQVLDFTNTTIIQYTKSLLGLNQLFDFSSTIKGWNLDIPPSLILNLFRNICEKGTEWNLEIITPQTNNLQFGLGSFDTSNKCNLTIPASSAGLNPANPLSWWNRTFKSITLT